MDILYFGKPYSFSHVAAIKRFGKENNFISMHSVKDSIDSIIQSKNYSLAVVPIENTYGGMVNETVDEFSKERHDMGMIVKEELIMAIEPYLLGNKDMKFSEIRRIYSHEYALKSCGKWLKENISKARLIKLNSTSEAAERAKKENFSCAIAGLEAANHYNLRKISKIKIDGKENMTAFFVLGRI